MTDQSVGTWLLAVMIVVAPIAGASPPVGESAAHEAPQPGMESAPRVRLDLTPAQQEVLKSTMREHLETLEAIVAALARQNHRQAAALAHAGLGFPKHHEAMRREQGATFPKQYQALAIEHHQAAEQLADAITAQEPGPILEQLANTIHACTACHKEYKL